MNSAAPAADDDDEAVALGAATYERSYEYVPADPTVANSVDKLICINKKTSKVTTTRRVLQSQMEHVYTNRSYSLSPHSSPTAAERPANGGSRSPMHNFSDFNDYLVGYALPSAPGAPHIVSYDDRSVTLSWTPPDRIGDCGYIDGYQVHFCNTTEPDRWRPAFDELIADTECTVSNLQPGQRYAFCVVAKSATGFGQPSTASPFVQLKDASFGRVHSKSALGAPTAPRALTLSHDAGNVITLSWDPPAFCGNDGSLIGYEVECRAENDGTHWMVIGQSVAPIYRLSEVQDSCTYEFRVIAKNSCGSSPPSDCVVYDAIASSSYDSTANCALPGPPVDLRICGVDSTCCTLYWSPPVQRAPASPLTYLVQYREIGDPKWRNAANGPVASTQMTVVNLRPNSTYEFRIFSQSPAGSSALCLVSDILQLRPSVLSSMDCLKTVPDRPSAPVVIEIRGNSVIVSWEPMAGVQGYQLEFCDVTMSPDMWNPLNEILTLATCMNVNDLITGHEYSFRVIAKNAIGYSEPSESSRPVNVVRTTSSGDGVPLPIEMREAQESPPITDTDESPPPLRCVAGQWHSGVQYRDPTLAEVVDYLDNASDVIRLNAAGYLQHLTYNDDHVKQKVRALGGIAKLASLLTSDVPEVQKNAAGCLRNLSYGNEDNKRAISQAGGLVTLVDLLKRTPEVLIVEEVTGTLWNMSSCRNLKMEIFELCADHLIKQIVVPYCSRSSVVQPPLIFRNATGILLNVSSAGDTIRRALRDRPELVENLVAFLRSALAKNDFNSKTVENVVCLTRNLSYRLQEVEVDKYGRRSSMERSRSAPSDSPKGGAATMKNFGRKKKQSDPSATAYDGQPELARVAPLLRLDTVRLYMSLLQNSTNADILEASAGAVQNLCSCDWQPSEAARIWIRKDKGLPVFVELLRTDSEKVKTAAACALRNLAMDLRNRDLIGKYAMVELVALLPYAQHCSTASEELIVAALGLIYATASSSCDFARTLHDRGGVPRLLNLANGIHSYSSRVRVYSKQVLKAVWNHRDLQDALRKAGVKEEDFLASPGRAGSSAVSTLIRPISASGIDQYGSACVSGNHDGPYDNFASVQYGMDRLQIVERHSSEPYDRTPPPYCTANYASADPLYAQIQKLNRGRPVSLNSSYSNNLHQPAGDSWV